MGTIRIGRKGSMSYSSTSAVAEGMGVPSPALSEEERKSVYDGIMLLPKSKRVAALRNAGFVDEANEYEQQLAEEHLRELNANVDVAEQPDEGTIEVTGAETLDVAETPDEVKVEKKPVARVKSPKRGGRRPKKTSDEQK